MATLKNTTITFRLPAETNAIFSALCALKGVTAASILRERIDEFIEENKGLLNLDALKKEGGMKK